MARLHLDYYIVAMQLNLAEGETQLHSHFVEALDLALMNQKEPAMPYTEVYSIRLELLEIAQIAHCWQGFLGQHLEKLVHRTSLVHLKQTQRDHCPDYLIRFQLDRLSMLYLHRLNLVVIPTMDLAVRSFVLILSHRNYRTIKACVYVTHVAAHCCTCQQ